MGLRNRTLLEDNYCFFVTTTCYKFLHLFRDNSYYDLLTHSISYCNTKYKVSILGYVLMPNHVHLILYFQEDNALANYMRDFKKFTSGEIRRKLEYDGFSELLEQLRFTRKEQQFKVWMDKFDDLVILNRETLETKLNYIHDNPLRKGLCSSPKDYKYSSASFYNSGIQPPINVTDYREIF